MLSRDQKIELSKVPDSWIKMYGMEGLRKRFGVGETQLKKAMEANKLLADQLEQEWAKK